MVKTEKHSEKIAERKEKLKHGSLFPALNYLSTGYLVAFFYSCFFAAYYAETFLAENPSMSEAFSGFASNFWMTGYVGALSVIGLVFVGVIVDLLRKRLSNKSFIVTTIVTVVFLVLVLLSKKIFLGMF